MILKKYKEKKIFVTGVSGSGKTFFAEKYAKIFNCYFISFDANWNYQNSADLEYQKIVKKYSDEFITDAIPYTYTNGSLKFLEYYNEHKDDIKIICLCCTDKGEFDKRIETKSFKSKTQAYDEYYNFYFDAHKNNYSNLNIEYYDSYTNEFISEEELFKRIDWIIKYNLKKYLDVQAYDKYYQDIECINFTGYTQSFKTWNNIKDLVNWNGKKIADLGCFHCYFAFKVAKLGAIVTGLDINDNVLKTSKYINELEGNIITIKKWAGGEEVSCDYDITLCLNVLHHFPDTRKALQNIKSKIVIFETNQELLNVISEEFNVVKKVESHRPDVHGNIRIILLCQRK